MKEIKAYVHSSRVSDVLSELKNSAAWSAVGGDGHNLTVYMVKGSLVPQDDSERHYSMDLGQEVINEYKLELHCNDEQVGELVDVIRRAARTGKSDAGWIYVHTIDDAIRVA
ncbi:MAG: P-II family nitrogen regulator [Piscinibacter sp.]|uniref:P-II family nitrogen regulator n=1 Tax=Piscinibacter sp. TaxID=1903157 RepID=UPI002588FAEE|nr:P-II family nitrogen regulator [Piscinibacter sp.]MCW5662335.1 P-II family nitrogen regulator [Piscinibacter sp.]